MTTEGTGGALGALGAGAGEGGEAPQAPWAGAEGMWNLGEGDAAKPWYASIADEGVRNHMEAKQFANPAAVAASNYELTKLQTGAADVLSIPGTDATPEQWNEVYTKLGRPEAPDGYDLKFDDGVMVDPKMLEFGKNTFHKAGLNGTQAKIVADEWNSMAAQAQSEITQQAQERNATEMNDLTTRWGADLDKNKAAGRRAMDAVGASPELVERVEGNIGSAAVVELLALIGRKSDEGGFVATGQQSDPNNPATMNKEQAASAVAELRGDAEFMKAYEDAKHPNHKEALARMEALMART